VAQFSIDTNISMAAKGAKIDYTSRNQDSNGFTSKATRWNRYRRKASVIVEMNSRIAVFSIAANELGFTI
jgi:hypothetical protein